MTQAHRPIALQFVTLNVPLQPTHTLRDRIEMALGQLGAPLRWAITAVDNDVALIEAVIRHE
ncbi:MAG: hypothetical protein WBA10_03765 [Elainellaceae cyanobacterium]